jgi:hypothetical protein
MTSGPGRELPPQGGDLKGFSQQPRFLIEFKKPVVIHSESWFKDSCSNSDFIPFNRSSGGSLTPKTPA